MYVVQAYYTQSVTLCHISVEVAGFIHEVEKPKKRERLLKG